MKQSKKDAGVRFIDPNNPGNNMRVMPEKPGSPYPNSQEPYSVRYENGSPVDAAGNPIPNPTGMNQNRSPELHVPLRIFKF